jgi:hypothetical protein
MNAPFRSARIALWFFLLFLGSHAAFAAELKEPDLDPPHGEILPTFWELHSWQVGMAVLVFLVLVGAIVLVMRQPKPVVLEPPAAIARRALESWRGRPVNDALVVQVSRILRRYARATFKFPPGEMTTAEFRQALQSHPQIDADLAAAIGDFLRRCDEWKFAATPSPQPAIVADAVALVEKTEMTRQHVPGQKIASATAS